MFEILGVLVGLVVYFVPCLVASRRNHNNAMPIFVVNLFLGWTFLGWVVSMAWAMSANVKKSKAEESTA